MGTVHKFRRRPRNEKQFRGYQPPMSASQRRSKRRSSFGIWSRMRGWQRSLAIWGLLILVAGLFVGASKLTAGGSGALFQCAVPIVIDGDTLRCGDRRVRLHGIDAPELAGHCRPGRSCTPGDPYASADNLRRLVGAGSVQCRQMDADAYGRTVAACSVAGKDLSCGQLGGGYAVRRYGDLWC